MSLKNLYAPTPTKPQKVVQDALERVCQFYDEVYEKFLKFPNADYAHALCRALYLINDEALATPHTLIWAVLGNAPYNSAVTKDHIYYLMMGYSDWLQKRRVGEW